ncbi:hypothetical protein [Brevundimonas sp. DWR2-3-1b1]|uniref:hypothetical protein n=1 Tax=unclassified Brevundimonas TaxID=2622653 RepID=UPI003CEE9156
MALAKSLRWLPGWVFGVVGERSQAGATKAGGLPANEQQTPTESLLLKENVRF